MVYNHLYFEELISTNEYLVERLQNEELEDGFIVRTAYQKAGKGLDKNCWESEKKTNLLFSLLLKPHYLAISSQFLLNKIISLALYDYTQQLLTDKAVSIKWPNDLYVENRKLAGILINNIIKGNSFDYAIVGIGYNVNQDAFYSDAPNPVSLKQLTGNSHKLESVFIDLLNAIAFRLNQLKANKTSQINSDYLDAMYRFGIHADYMVNNEKITARITGLDAYGRLELKKRDETIYCDLKEVSYII